MKTNLFRGISLIILMLMFQFAQAQNNVDDVVTLRNGSIIKGQILERTEEKLRIKTSDGREYIFNMPEIEKIEQQGNTRVVSPTINDKAYNNKSDKNARRVYTPKSKGFWFSAELQLIAPPSLNIIAGYKLHQFAYLGLGTGIHNYTDLQIFSGNREAYKATIIPVYLRYSGDILNKRVTPVYHIEGGYGFAVSNYPLFESIIIDRATSTTKGGFYGSLGFGFKVRTNKHVSFGAGFVYRVQLGKEERVVYNTYDTEYTYHYVNQRFGMKLIIAGFN